MLYKLSWGILLAGLTACSDLTDSYKEYLDWGERVYAGKMDFRGSDAGEDCGNSWISFTLRRVLAVE